MDLVPQLFEWLLSGSGEKRQPHHGFDLSSARVNIFRWLPCGWNHVCWKSVIERSFFFWGWCNGVRDSARDFYLLGELVPYVLVSARTFALRGFFHLYLYWLPSSSGFINIINYYYLNIWSIYQLGMSSLIKGSSSYVQQNYWRCGLSYEMSCVL